MRQDISVELNMRFSSAESHERAAGWWLTEAPLLVSPRATQAVLGRDLPLQSVVNVVGAFGAEGEPYGFVRLRQDPDKRGRLWAYGQAAVREMLSALASRPASVGVSVGTLDPFGQLNPTDDFEVARDDDGVVTFSAVRRRPAGPVSTDDSEDLFAEHCRQAAMRALDEFDGEILFAAVAPDSDPRLGTAFERQTRTPRLDPLRHELLRGYSWFTVISLGLARRVGGHDTARKHYFHVTELESGAMALQATELFGQYAEAEVERSWDFLRPLLPAGTPSLPGPFSAPVKLVFQDAHKADDSSAAQ